MSRRFIDLSISLDNNPNTDPVWMPVQISYYGHHETVSQLQRAFPAYNLSSYLTERVGP